MSAQTSTFSTDPALYIFTSLTAGSSHIITATLRLETILRAHRIPFKAVDIAFDEKARMLWGRRAGKDAGGRARKIPGLVQEGIVLGDLEEIEEWNEYGELKQHVKYFYDEFTIPPISQAPPPKPAPAPAPAPAATPSREPVSSSAASTKSTASSAASGMASIAAEAAAAATAPHTLKRTVTNSSTASSTKSVQSSLADEVAQKARQLRLQSLRNQVYGKGGDKTDKADGEKSDDQAGGDRDEGKKDGGDGQDAKTEAQVDVDGERTVDALDEKDASDQPVDASRPTSASQAEKGKTDTKDSLPDETEEDSRASAQAASDDSLERQREALDPSPDSESAHPLAVRGPAKPAETPTPAPAETPTPAPTADAELGKELVDKELGDKELGSEPPSPYPLSPVGGPLRQAADGTWSWPTTTTTRGAGAGSGPGAGPEARSPGLQDPDTGRW